MNHLKNYSTTPVSSTFSLMTQSFGSLVDIFSVRTGGCGKRLVYEEHTFGAKASLEDFVKKTLPFPHIWTPMTRVNILITTDVKKRRFRSR